MLGEIDINNQVKQYIKKVILILTGTSLAFLVCINIAAKPNLLQPIIISLSYNTIISIICIYIWKVIAQHSRDYIIHFYLGATGFRLVTAMFVVLAYFLREDLFSQRLQFAFVFCIYYLVMLIVDTSFFLKVEGQIKK